MKKFLGNVASVVISLLVILTIANATQLKEARVTQVVSDVKLLPQQAAPRPATLNASVRNGTAVRTGTQSRSELTFPDLTITRLGANTIFSFEEGTRTMDLRDGAILFQVPKGAGGATIRTTAVTAAITGTTGIGEFHPATAGKPQPFSKWLCLEGSFHLTLPNGQSVEIGPGKMVTTDGKNFSPVLTFNIEQVMRTSLLVVGNNTPLASLPLIQIEQENQEALMIARTPITNASTLLDPANIIDVVDQGMTAQESPTPPLTPTPSTPTPTPGKFGALTVVTSPDPYVIKSGTVISTDPSITTSGHTDYGKIYRSQAQDGLLSVFLFGSTSAFDTASGFDSDFTGVAMGAAGFKFTSLKLTGDPMISTAGGSVNLGLIAVNGITSGGPGGVLSFAGIRGLLLATENGSIDLGSEISFSGLNDIAFYARGSGSTLTLASDVTTTDRIRLYGESGIQLSSDLSTQDLIAFTNGDFDFTGGSIDAETISIISGGDLTFSLGTPLSFNTKTFLLQAEGNIQVNDSLEIIEDSLSPDADLNISLVAESENIHVEGDLSLTTNPGDVTSGANIVLTSGGDTTIGGALTLHVDNSNGGHIGTGGNISVATGGNLTADSVDALVNNRDSGSIGSGGNVTFNIDAALTTTGDASFITTNRNDGNGGGMIGSNVVLTLNAASVSVGGFFITDISTNGGGNIPNATVNVNVTGNLAATGGAQIDIQNTGFNVIGGPFIAGATIGADAKVNVSAGSISSGDTLDVAIDNNGAGHIGRDALIGVTVSNNINSHGDVFFDILNQATNGAPAGFIGRNAAVNLTAGNISSDGSLESIINNSGGGHIVGEAAVNFDASGDIGAPSGADFEIFNVSGVIGSDATMNVSARNITAADSFLAQISNYTGGSIGRNAFIDFTLSGNISTQGDATFAIDNGFGGGLGAIGGNANIVVSGANLTSGGVFQAFMGNYDGSEIGGNALIDFNLSGNLTIHGDATFTIDTGFGGGLGTIGGDAKINVHAANLNAGSSFSAFLLNYDGAQIAEDASINFVLSGDINTQADASFEIFNTNTSGNGSGGMIGGSASINLAAGDVTAGTFFPQIQNQLGGTIGSSAIINVDVASILSTASDGLFGVSISNFDGGNIGGNALINVAVSGDVNAPSEVEFSILNDDVSGGGGGTIGSDATINVSANNISTAGVFFAQIHNDGGGSIGGNATINMNVSGSATAASDATFQILGSDGAAAAAINVNGGSYTAGGTFRAFIDGDGTIAFHNASVHADVLKVGVLGTNGVLTIGGGTLSADSTLKLYASGSNGQLNFISNVTLGGASAKILAANSVTIFNGVVVTVGNIADENPADVYTNHANYSSEFGGNDSTTGTFAGSGANDPQPLSDAPPFDDVRPAPSPSSAPRSQNPPRPPARPSLTHSRPLPSTHLTSANRAHGEPAIAAKKPARAGIQVSDSGQLLSLLDRTTDAGRKVAVQNSNGTRGKESPGRADTGRSNSNRAAANTPLQLGSRLR